jgi:ABC-type spermidine/putrescine transport system permease subunit I
VTVSPDASFRSVDGSVDADLEHEERLPSRLAATVVMLVAALVFAWSVWAAIGNLSQVPAQFGAYRDFVTKGGAPELAKNTPWVALIAALVVPVLGYLAALWLGRRRGLRARIVLFVVAYAAVCALTVSLTAYVFQTSAVF